MNGEWTLDGQKIQVPFAPQSRLSEYKGTISKKVDVDYFPFEVANKERLSMEIVNEIAPNAEDWEIIKELNKVLKNFTKEERLIIDLSWKEKLTNKEISERIDMYSEQVSNIKMIIAEKISSNFYNKTLEKFIKN